MTPLARSAVTDWVAMFVEVSPESFWVMLILMPSFAALMSETARLDASMAGGPRVASDPVCGRIVPTLRVRVLLGVLDPPADPGATAQNEGGGAENGNARDRGAEGLRA